MNITIGRYEVPTEEQRTELEAAHPDCAWPSDTWESWVEPEDRSWILWIGRDGSPAFWPHREPSGAVIGEPIGR